MTSNPSGTRHSRRDHAVSPSRWLSVAVAVFLGSASVSAETIMAYGPGGPTPAIKEAAAAFEEMTGNEVIVTAGPAGAWMEKARTDADLIYSGSENMMTAFFAAHGSIQQDTVVPLYMRPNAILVRKGNPKDIKGLQSLLDPGLNVMVVQGAGQVGMWEDSVGRLRDIGKLEAFRNNIVFRAPNSGVAREHWKTSPDVDAWLIWNHWQIDNPDLADMVAVEPDLAIYRDTGIGLTELGMGKPEAAGFIDFLLSDRGQEIFAAHGWQRSF